MSKLHNMALDNLEGAEKKSFVPMPGGQPPPMDPAAGGGMPMDPSMGGGMPMDPAMGGGMPMDPAMGGGMPMDPGMGGAPVDPMLAAGAGPAEPSVPPPGAAAGDPAADPMYDMLVQAIRSVLPQVLQEMGIEGKDGEGEKKPKKKSTDERLAGIEEALGIGADQGAAGMSSAAGEGSDGEGSVSAMEQMAPPMGPMDPNAADTLSQLGSAQGSLGAMQGAMPLQPQASLDLQPKPSSKQLNGLLFQMRRSRQ
jgi:hypothetical protein